jgi:transcriptional regulator with XRE-family HTH domain
MIEAYEKIRFFREQKKWSQEEMAARLGISTNGYAKLERGESALSFARLKQIATVLEIELTELLNFGEKNVFYITGDNAQNNSCCNQFSNIHSANNPDEAKIQLQLEKLYLIVQQQSKEIEYLKEIIQLLNGSDSFDKK